MLVWASNVLSFSSACCSVCIAPDATEVIEADAIVVVVEEVVVEFGLGVVARGASGAKGINTVVVETRATVVEVVVDEACLFFGLVEVVVKFLRCRIVVVVVVVAPGAVAIVVVGIAVVEVVDVVVPFVGAAPPELGCGTLFVTEVAESDAASLPAESCTAFASLLPEGSVYATVTD